MKSMTLGVTIEFYHFGFGKVHVTYFIIKSQMNLVCSSFVLWKPCSFNFCETSFTLLSLFYKFTA